MSRLPFVAGVVRRRTALAAVAAVAAGTVLFVGGCTPTPPVRILTDPHEIMATAIRTTASLSYVRLHADLKVSRIAPAGAEPDLRMTVDVDIDVTRRLRAGRVATQMDGGPGGQAPEQPNLQEFITLADASYSRTGGFGRWAKGMNDPNGRLEGPTSAGFAAIETLLSKPGVTLELREAAPCSLGTCYHVIATVDGELALQAIGSAIGQPTDGPRALPPFAFDLLIDQATGLLSEVRFEATFAGSSNQLVAVFSNPNVVFQIVAPPPELVDAEGFGNDGGFGEPVPAATPAPQPQSEPPP